ncbi:MAG TPA: hypothetical protein P5511_04280 [Candidatus Goldiibacteriota bacterium]|nr:hypothetical protein [Candidatus Goldiibacteriota bacterium]
MLKKAQTGLVISALIMALCQFYIVSIGTPLAVAEDEYLIKPLYEFKNKAKRDPFSARHEKDSTIAAVSVDITTFSLIGITQSGQLKTALFKSKNGTPFGYIFAEGRLYGENDRVIEGIEGEIRGVDIVLLRQGDREVIFKLDVSTEGPNIRPEQNSESVY